MHTMNFYEQQDDPKWFLVDADGTPTYILHESKEDVEAMNLYKSIHQIDVWDYHRCVSVYIEKPSGEHFIFCVPITNNPKWVADHIACNVRWTSNNELDDLTQMKWKSRMSHDSELDNCWHKTFRWFAMHNTGFYIKNEIKEYRNEI